MKKIISALLVLVMVASMGAFAFADEAAVEEPVVPAIPLSYVEETPEFPITPVEQAKIDAVIAAAEKAAAEAPIDTREEVDAYVCKVNSRYTQVHNGLKCGTCYVSTDKSVVLHFVKGDLVQLEKNATDDFNYYRNFTYDKDGKLVFCYYENSKESYRMYFAEDVLVYALIRNNEKGTSMIKYLAAAQEDLADWAAYAVYEAKNYDQYEFAGLIVGEPTELDLYCADVDAKVVKAYRDTHYGACKSEKIRTGVVVNLVNGKCSTIDVAKGTNELAFERRYYLNEEGEPIYCEFKNGSEAFSFYLNEEGWARVHYTTIDEVEDEFLDQWVECAIAECSSILRDAAL